MENPVENQEDATGKQSGRPKVDLEPYKAEVIALHEKKMKGDDICKHLKRQHDIQISPRTLTKRLQHWGVKKKMENYSSNETLHARIKNLFFDVGLGDSEIVTVLNDEGYSISLRTLRRLRHQLGIRLRLDSPTGQQEQVQEILEALVEEMDKGTIEGYGKELLHNHFRSKGYVFARDRLYSVYRMLRPDTVERRTSDVPRRVPPPKILAGPNLTWHVNNYSKLANFGFRIHAEIDSFSRFVLWLNVGVGAHTAVSVLKHHLDAVSSKGRQPRTLRSDLESEVPLLAEAHFNLRRASEPDVERDQCCAPGRATDTHRIESWWAQLAKSVVTLFYVSQTIPPQVSILIQCVELFPPTPHRRTILKFNISGPGIPLGNLYANPPQPYQLIRPDLEHTQHPQTKRPPRTRPWETIHELPPPTKRSREFRSTGRPEYLATPPRKPQRT
jgi:hypothetical protein